VRLWGRWNDPFGSTRKRHRALKLVLPEQPNSCMDLGIYRVDVPCHNPFISLTVEE
jgi:hypothetical protein